jgi:hypothetical protein
MKAGYSGRENEKSTARIGRKDLTEAHGVCPEHRSQVEKEPAQVAAKSKAPRGEGKRAAGRRPDRRAAGETTLRGGGIVEQFDYLWRNRWP